MQISVTPDVFKLAQVFTISRGSRTEAKVLTVKVEEDGYVGWGECVPYARYGETLENVTQLIESVKGPVTREGLYTLPAGAARNALDCALWDLECKKAGKRAWELAGLPQPGPEITAYTLSLAEPAEMQAQAAKNA
ncbi:MAG: dipeptide epimerase, partial [Shimia sp.]|nr:dipeptide epimerase [Shimia sp.]